MYVSEYVFPFVRYYFCVDDVRNHEIIYNYSDPLLSQTFTSFCTLYIVYIVYDNHQFFSLFFETGGFYNRITKCLSSISLLFPNRLCVRVHQFDDRTQYREWLVDDEFRSNFCEQDGKEHVSCPIVWISNSPREGDPDPADITKYLGGHDATLDWCRVFMNPAKLESYKPEAVMVADGNKADHGYDYDVSSCVVLSCVVFHLCN